MNEFRISAYAASNVGKRRQNNEDNYYIAHNKVNSSLDTNAIVDSIEGAFIGSVCDGMGGEAAGEVASHIAVEVIEAFENDLILQGCSDKAINDVVSAANEKICNEIYKYKKRMGTTFTLIGITNENVTISNVGDSRVYRYSDNTLTQVSHDHTEAQTMVDAGIVTMEQSMKLKEKHRLTQHLGIFTDEMIIEPYTVRLPIKINDRYMLCSDGLTDMLTEPEIKAILDENLTIKDTVNKLISSAIENGGRDNVTVLLCEIKVNEKNISPQSTPSANSTETLIKAFNVDEDNIEKENIVVKPLESKSEKFNIWKLVSFLLATVILILGVTLVANNAKHKNEDKTTSTTVAATESESTTVATTEDESTTVHIAESESGTTASTESNSTATTPFNKEI